MGEAVEHFSYDLVGNRLTDNVTTGSWAYNKNNELRNFDNTSFKYNLNGQMTEKTVNGTKTYYSYNLDGRLKEIKDNSSQVIAQYQYDLFGRRTQKYLPQTNDTIYFHYSNEGLIAEYDETGKLVQSYGYKPDSWYTTDPVFTYRPDFPHAKGYAYYIKDHLGTPQKLITNTGRKVWEASADAFGNTTITNNEFRNPLSFPGQYSDEESQLRYNYFRYYDPQLGRYITSDPIGLIGGLNTYGYVYQNPLNSTDPTGLICGTGACVGIGYGIGLGASAIGGYLWGQELLDDYNNRPTPMFTDRPERTPWQETYADQEHKRYKDFCNNKPQKTGDRCTDLKNELDWKKQCRDLRQNWDDKWFPGRHEGDINKLNKGIKNLQRRWDNAWSCHNPPPEQCN